jgi:hypothetical protein
MTSQPDQNRQPLRQSRPPRRVVLEAVIRRDAAQRLGLALTLLARAYGDGRTAAGEGEPVPAMPDTPARPGAKKEGPA